MTPFAVALLTGAGAMLAIGAWITVTDWLAARRERAGIERPWDWERDGGTTYPLCHVHPVERWDKWA